MRNFGKRFWRALRSPIRQKTKEEWYANIAESIVEGLIIIAFIVWFCKAG